MKIKVNTRHTGVIDMLSRMADTDYVIMGSFNTEAAQEPYTITVISIHSQEWAEWIEKYYHEWIIR